MANIALDALKPIMRKAPFSLPSIYKNEANNGTRANIAYCSYWAMYENENPTIKDSLKKYGALGVGNTSEECIDRISEDLTPFLYSNVKYKDDNGNILTLALQGSEIEFVRTQTTEIIKKLDEGYYRQFLDERVTGSKRDCVVIAVSVTLRTKSPDTVLEDVVEDIDGKIYMTGPFDIGLKVYSLIYTLDENNKTVPRFIPH